MQYSYFNPAPRLRNPLTTGVGVGLLAGLALVTLGTGVAVAAVREKDVKPRKPKHGQVGPAPGPVESSLSGVYAEGATLGAISDASVLQAIQAPVAISMYDINEGDGAAAPTTSGFPAVTRAESLVTRGRDGDLIPLEYIAVSADGSVNFQVDKDALLAGGVAVDLDADVPVAGGGQAQILRLVTGLTGGAAAHAYAKAVALVRDQNYLLDEPSGTRDDYVRQVLDELAPHIDWSEGPEGLAVGSPAWEAWMGVDLVGQVAYQNFWSTQ